MTKQYNKIGVTTGGYRGNRAILEQRVIEGFKVPSFQEGVLELNPETPQTLYLTSTNMADGNIIILPNAQDLWNNWRTTIINESAYPVNIYYYTNDLSQLNLFKEISSGNMATFILLENSSTTGVWTTLRTTEITSAEQVEKYTSNILDTIEINWNQIQGNTSPIVFTLSPIMAGTAVKSIYLKTIEQFVSDGSDEDPLSLSISVGIGNDESDEEYSADHFISNYDLTQPVSDTNFTKDLFDEILSTTDSKYVCATITGNNLSSLVGGKLQITIERAKLIDPTVLKNPIIQTNLPIGTVMNYIFSDVPEGFLRLDGSLYPNANAAIPNFIEKLNAINNQLVGEKLIIGIDEWNQTFAAYGSCGKFSWQGSSLRFPAINCFIQGMSDLTQLSKLTPAGLPNITGGFRAQPDLHQSAGSAYGAFTQYNPNGKVDSGGSGGGYHTGFTFDASRCSTVYGNSNTVTPLNVKYPYIISVYNKIQNSSVIDLNALLEDSVFKLNNDLNNVDYINISPADKLQFAQWGYPDYNSPISFTWDVHYTLDYPVYVFVNVQLMNTRAYININGLDYELAGFDSNDGHGSTCTFLIPKNITFYVHGGRQSSKLVYFPLLGAI